VQGIKRALAAGRDLTVAEALDDVARWNAEHLDADEVLREMSARIQERSSATSGPEPGS
jgi:hypothetical protein